MDEWNNATHREGNRHPIDMYFVSLNLRDLPESALRERVLNIPTRFFLPETDINDLKQAARQLLEQSGEYQRLMQDLGSNAPPPATPHTDKLTVKQQQAPTSNMQSSAATNT